ncbi:putative hemolysin [Mitsuaria sp. BK045]|uniref:GNAT family N-acetyltransferase n=1 Tax=unclassified Roseateles TaxID=2626991 RepID=UPI00161291AD|nr:MULTISPECIES: GNAT family N-acyltransferase [unclassified Roseateles]MBB3296330.1 putative hemolysin [Mitsuaria sp. BK041]MBB3365545.1 putative hemolysin [Mitsuaria sp. BK045]
MRDLPLPTLPFSDLRPAEAPRRSLPASSQDVVVDAARARFHVGWARTEDEVRQAQRLRYQVFVDEMGARLSVPAGAPAGHDIDLFDPFCEHLLVRTLDEHGQPAEVIGTYRVLTPEAARRAGGLYSETEFDLTRLRSLRPRMVELGRSCVHPDHRHGGAIMALWGALAEFMVRNNLDTMIGCASISMRDGGHYAASLWRQLEGSHLADIAWQVRPRLPLPVDDLRQDLVVEPPPLIKGYLRVGARILGRPAWDPDFNTADLPMIMRIADLPARYRKHFLGGL